MWPLGLVIAVTAWPLTFLSVACNVAVLHVVARRLASEPAQMADGLRRPPRECLSRSAAAFRGRWGDSVAGTVSIVVCLCVATIPASMVLGAGVAFGGHDVASAAAIVLGFAVLLLCGTVASTMRELFALALWRDEGLPGFHPADLEAGLKLRPRGRRRLPWRR